MRTLREVPEKQNRGERLRKLQKKFKKENSDLIKSFISLQDQPENYEVWVPYHHHGIVGFIDLVVKSESEISLFKFIKNAKKIEKAVKSLKLERTVFPKSRNITSKEIHTYLVVGDGEKNRKSVLSQERILQDQPFDILFLDRERGRVESIFELRDNLPRLFQTKNSRLEESALDALITNPDHSQVESAILKLDDPPEVITRRFIKKIQRYLRKNNRPPKDIDTLREATEKRKHESYTASSGERDVKSPQKS